MKDDTADDCHDYSGCTTSVVLGTHTEICFYETRGACENCGDGFRDNETVYCTVQFTQDGGYSVSNPICSECAGY